MKYSPLLFFFLFYALSACKAKSDTSSSPPLISLQTIDRNGFSETTSTKERIQKFAQTDFLSSQPYQKVLRVYERDKKGISTSKITSYHTNGHIQQYLEIVEGRANGAYKEWYPNGILKIEANVIEGLGEVSEAAQMSWVFDGKNTVWDENGNILALFHYIKGVLEGTALYYHPNGQIARSIPYVKDLIEGNMQVFDENGQLLENVPFSQGIKEGIAEGTSKDNSWSYHEEYTQGALQQASYTYRIFSSLPNVVNGEGYQAIFENDHLSKLVEIHQGKPSGSVRFFHKNGSVKSICHFLNEKKHGEEREFYPSLPLCDPLSLPSLSKVLVFWHEDVLQGITKTWYENGILESEREMNQNRKHGLSSAYYKDGSLMLMEEYKSGRLWKGSYFKKGDKQPISRVIEGHGTATLYHGEGHFIRKTSYEKGIPLLHD